MFYHIVALALTQSFGAAELAETAVFATRIKAQCPDLIDFALVPNLSARGNGYTHCVIGTFRNRDGYDVYPACEGHVAFAEFMRPFILDMVVLDCEPA